MEEQYKCAECGWIGKADELEYEKVESCMGDDQVEVCPKCGSMSVFRSFAPKIPSSDKSLN
jgi:predicted RNA-binding Zn-ribbon protein involved in translation (DUF1610 family)